MNKKELEDLYWNQKLTIKEISDIKSCAPTSIIYWMEKHKIPRRTVSEAKRKWKYLPSKEEIKSLYWERELTQKEIGEMFEMPESTIGRYMKRYKISTRVKIKRDIRDREMRNGRRQCSKCKIWKPLSEFHKDKRVSDGYKSQCKTCCAEYLKTWRHKNKEKIRLYRQQNREKKAEYDRKRTEKLRTEVLNRLGGECVLCEFSNYKALQIDHIHNDGKKDRNSMSCDTYYRYLLSLSDEELHANYQCLCANCNWIKRCE